MCRKLLRFFSIALLISPLVCGLTLSYYFYDVLSRVQPNCGIHSNLTPASYTAENVDPSPYLMPQFEDVRLPSRQSPLQIAAFWMPVPQPETAQTVIIVHGNAACRRSPASLLPAGMLSRAGYNALVIDMRDVGDSDFEDGRSAAGTEEYLDLLGAWDWLQSEHGIEQNRIGVFGYSLGGATAINAAGAESGIRALWTDSAFAHLDDIIDHATRNAQWLRLFRPSGMLIGLLVSGDNLYSPSPVEQARFIGNRPFYLVHGTADEVVPYGQLERLREAAQLGGTQPQVWTTSSHHVDSMFDQTEEYERRLIDFFSGALGD
jgi:fermentation-respiration switch protein FrsA (DUF1100 family)